MIDHQVKMLTSLDKSFGRQFPFHSPIQLMMQHQAHAYSHTVVQSRNMVCPVRGAAARVSLSETNHQLADQHLLCIYKRAHPLFHQTCKYYVV